MWIYFNDKGQILEILEHGSPAVAGTTRFEIFAYFENVDIGLTYNNATIKLRKPDLAGSEYPLLLMEQATKNFVLDEEHDEHSSHFENGQSYRGFYFDFGDFNSDSDIEVLLDTPGLWEAIITLVGSNRKLNVQGTATFYVLDGISNADGSEVEIDKILNKIYLDLAKKLNADSDSYLRVVEDIRSFRNTDFPEATFNVGDIIFNKLDGSFYKLNSLEYEEGVNPEHFMFIFSSVHFESVEVGTTITLPSASSIILEDGEELATKTDIANALNTLPSLYLTIEDEEYVIPEEDR